LFDWPIISYTMMLAFFGKAKIQSRTGIKKFLEAQK
jgi:hypothetical protein